MVSNYPKHWKVVKLGELISSLESGKRPKGGVQDIKSGIPSVGGEHLNSFGGFDFSKIKYVPEDFANYMTKGNIQINDIIIVKDGATTAKTSLVRKDFPFKKAVINEHVFICRLINHVDSKFIFYKLWSESGRKEILTDFRGAAQGGISSNFVNKVNIPFPPLPEQHRIVEKIEELFSELDNGITNLMAAKKQLKIYRQSVLKWAFEGRLTNEDVKDGELPEGWKWVKVNEVIDKAKNSLKAGPFGSSLKKEFYVENGFKIYGQEQVINGDPFFGNYFISEIKYKKLISNSIKPGDVLISLVGTVGKVLILPDNCLPGIINPRLIKVSLNQKIYLPKYFKYYFDSELVKSFYGKKARGTTMDVLNLGIIKTIPFPLCPIAEQSEIISEIESRFSLADQMERSINESLQKAEALRQSILKSAFEGKLI